VFLKVALIVFRSLYISTCYFVVPNQNVKTLNITRPPLDAGHLPTHCSQWFYSFMSATEYE